LRSGTDRLWSITIMSLPTTLAGMVCALVLPLPLSASWIYLGVSAALQVVYSAFLAYAYEHGALGEVYPIVRGSVPLLVTLGGFLIAGQRLSGTAVLGITLVSLGILSLALGRTRARAIVFALATGLFVASYVTTDGVGVRLAGNPQAYVAWIFVCYGALMPVAYVVLRGKIALDLRSPEALKAMAGGVVSIGSYGAIITALSLGQIGPISALRETSIVFSALIGRAFLGEALTRRRILVCVAVTLGAVCIGYGA
jgi:drug/metabolite transporter (DMT)-like permease